MTIVSDLNAASAARFAMAGNPAAEVLRAPGDADDWMIRLQEYAFGARGGPYDYVGVGCPRLPDVAEHWGLSNNPPWFNDLQSPPTGLEWRTGNQALRFGGGVNASVWSTTYHNGVSMCRPEVDGLCSFAVGRAAVGARARFGLQRTMEYGDYSDTFSLLVPGGSVGAGIELPGVQIGAAAALLSRVYISPEATVALNHFRGNVSVVTGQGCDLLIGAKAGLNTSGFFGASDAIEELWFDGVIGAYCTTSLSWGMRLAGALMEPDHHIQDTVALAVGVRRQIGGATAGAEVGAVRTRYPSRPGWDGQSIWCEDVRAGVEWGRQATPRIGGLCRISQSYWGTKGSLSVSDLCATAGLGFPIGRVRVDVGYASTWRPRTKEWLHEGALSLSYEPVSR